MKDQMIFMVGDIHGVFAEFWDAVNAKIEQAGLPDAIIQIGDFGLHTPLISTWKNDLDIPVYFIDGNHENFSMVPKGPDITTLKPAGEGNLHHIARGTVLEFVGKTFAFCGGGESIDKAYRKVNESWWAEERVTDENIADTIENIGSKKIDYLVTHTPPLSVIATHFPPLDLRDWGLHPNWTDESSIRIQKLWEHLNCPKIISGHMHMHCRGANYEILPIAGVKVIERGVA